MNPNELLNLQVGGVQSMANVKIRSVLRMSDFIDSNSWNMNMLSISKG